jgi:tetratricopeptide (TPR) repeat protein
VTGTATEGPAGEEPARLKREARDHFAAGRFEAARSTFAEALRQHPKDLDAREGLVASVVALGHRALDGGVVEVAIAHFQMALEMSPFHPGADAGLRKADALARERAPKDALGVAFEALPPVKAFRDLQAAERTVAKVTGMPPASQIVRARVDAREAGLVAAGAPPRERRMEHERAAAWRRRWVFRTLPAAVLGVGFVASMALGTLALLGWGLLFAGFAALWDLLFVERAAGRWGLGGPPAGGSP